MKNICILLTLPLLLISCHAKPELSDAKQTCEHYFELINQKAYADAFALSAEEFTRSSNETQSIKKMQKLHEKLGDVKSFVLKDSVLYEEFGQRAHFKLVYEVQHPRLKTDQTFLIVKEAGAHKVYNHTIVNTNF